MLLTPLTLCFAVAVDKQPPSATQILQASAAKVGSVRSIVGKFQMLGGAKIEGTFTLQKPDRFSVTLAGQEFHYDGKVYWQYRAKDKGALREKMPLSAAIQILFVMGFDPMFEQPRAPAVRTDMTDWNGDRVVEEIIDDDPASRTRIFFDPATELPCGFEQVHGTFPLTVKYSDVRVNAPVAANSFSFAPPPGTKITRVPDFALFTPGMSAPDFTLKTPQGQNLNLRAMVSGHKATLLNFWFVGCGPCREEYPHLQHLYTELGPKGLQIVSVNNGDPRDAVRKFLTDHSYTFPVCLSKPGDVVKRYNVNAFPTNFILDAKGKVIDSFTGFNRGRLYDALKKAGVDADGLKK